jgi:hypothetical protein
MLLIRWHGYCQVISGTSSAIGGFEFFCYEFEIRILQEMFQDLKTLITDN